MKKTGLEIVEMIARGEAPKKIKEVETSKEYKYEKERFSYETEEDILRITSRLNKEFEIIEEPKVWKPKLYDNYYYIDDMGFVIVEKSGDRIIDNNRIEIGNCFKTEEETEKMLEKLKIYNQLKRYALEHNEEKIDWNNEEQSKWHIMLYTRFNTVETANTYVHRDLKQVYFTSQEICGNAIQEIGKDNIKKLFED